MSSFPQLVGHVDDRDQQIATLKRQLSQLDDALRMERIKTGQVEAGVRELQHVLNPLYRALQKIYGEIGAIGIDATPVSTEQNPKWDFWKKRYPGRIADTIDLLLIQKSMNSSQLTAALKCDPRTLAKSVIYPLTQAGLLVKNGNMFSLKEL